MRHNVYVLLEAVVETRRVAEDMDLLVVETVADV